MTIYLPNNWKPRDYQKNAWVALEDGIKRVNLIWHRRAGKDEIALHWAACAAHERVGTYWHMLPEASQARKAIWDAVNPHTGKRRIDEAFPLALRENTRENEMFIRFKRGSTWQVVGSDNYDSLVGSPPIGVVFSEWALADPQAWAYLQPILEENGGTALFITTPRGENHAATMYEGTKSDPLWHTELLTAKTTGVFSQEQLIRIKESYERDFGKDEGKAKYEQEYLCSFSGALPGAYYGREMREADEEGRITEVPYDPAHQVFTSWDLGRKDETGIWFIQCIGYQYRIIDYEEASGVGLNHYAKILNGKPYVYGKHYLPHDADHERLGQTNDKSIAKQLEDLGISPIETVPSPPNSREAGIQKVRAGLHMCVFDRKKTDRGRSALRQYHREYDDKTKAFKPTPKHDWSSNGADALRTFFMGYSKAEKVQDIPMDTSWVA